MAWGWAARVDEAVLAEAQGQGYTVHHSHLLSLLVAAA